MDEDDYADGKISEQGLCECLLPGTKCALRLDAGGNATPGDLSLYNNGVCNVENFNEDCGWDGGDCVHALDNGTDRNYTLPTLGSENYCAVWSCTQFATSLATYCDGYYSYDWYWRGKFCSFHMSNPSLFL
mgnify:CR=1 FL=1